MISTYSELTTLTRKHARRLHLPVEIFEGGISVEGHRFAMSKEKDFEVFISYGGTGALIRQMLNKPVIEVGIRTSVLLRDYQEALSYGNPIVLLTYKSEVMQQLEAVAGLFPERHLHILKYGSKEEYESIAKKIPRMGKCTLFGVGDCIRNLGEKNNCPYVQIASEEKDVVEALVAAKKILELGTREKRHSLRLLAIINSTSEGLLVFDRAGNIILTNSSAEKLIGHRGSLVGTKYLDESAPELLKTLYADGSALPEGFAQLDNKPALFFNRIPVNVNGQNEELIVKFQPVKEIQHIELKARQELLNKGMVARYTFDHIIGNSPVLQQTITKARLFSRSSASVLLEGETGTGKELFVQSMHNESLCCNGPFVAVNCAALPESLLESELFGYEGGAFTGAKKSGRPGLFEMAHNGTIFLDEISEISPAIQARMLRVLQEREILRIGGDRVINVNIRIVAATNKALYEQVLNKHFRQDLYFRISPLKLRIPSLRQRREDIPALVEYFLQALNAEYSMNTQPFSPASIQLLQRYSWPGNIRELGFFVEKVVVLSSSMASQDNLVRHLLEEHIEEHTDPTPERDDLSSIRVPVGSMKAMQNSIIDILLKNTGGNKKLVSEMLDISRVTIWNRLRMKAAEV